MFLVQRTRGQGEARLHGAWSIGLGGHVEPEDAAGDRSWRDHGAAFFARSLLRELREELGIDIGAARFALTLDHDYEDRRVRLHFYYVDSFSGTPQSLDGQTLTWVPIEELHRQNILEADAPFVALIQQRRLPC